MLSRNFFYLYLFNDLTGCQNLWSCGSIHLKVILIFPKIFNSLNIFTKYDFKLEMFMAIYWRKWCMSIVCSAGIKNKTKTTINKIHNLKKVAVSPVASDRKLNPRMPEKMGFLAPKRNSLSVSIHYCYWTDVFFFWLLVVSTRADWVPRPCNQPCLLLVAASAKHGAGEKKWWLKWNKLKNVAVPISLWEESEIRACLKIDFLSPNRNQFSLHPYHWQWKDPFYLGCMRRAHVVIGSRGLILSHVCCQ